MRHSAEYIGKRIDVIDGRGKVCGRLYPPFFECTPEEIVSELNELESFLNNN